MPLEAKNEAGLLLLHQMLALTLYKSWNYPAVMIESIESDQLSLNIKYGKWMKAVLRTSTLMQLIFDLDAPDAHR